MKKKMKKGRTGVHTLMLTLALFLVVSCVSAESDRSASTGAGEETMVLADPVDETGHPASWSDETHSKSADPNYEVVFPDDEVNTMTIIIDPDDWEAMLEDMTALHGPQGSTGVRGQMPTGGRPAIGGAVPPGAPPTGAAPAGAPRAGLAQPGFHLGNDTVSENPMWVAATVQFEGDVWTDVGVRFKGNSSLMTTWSSGSLELPFKLDFDEFEDEVPAIKNQRFYGFRQLSLSNNTNDATFMRDTVASDMMAAADIIAAETAFYNLYVDYGEGPVNFGLYTMVEVIDDTVIKRVLGDDDGNIYEADGTAASFASGTFDAIEGSFQKENNEDAADWSDIKAVFDALHSTTRQSNPGSWREEVESVFDVDTFLHWLAINTVIENWDTYGAMTHNFYLYNNPETGQITWIPWDHNEALSEGKRGNMTYAMDRIGDDWPLISYLLDDDVYYDTYVDCVAQTITDVFEPESMVDTYGEIAELIEPYATEDVGAAAFARAVRELIDHTYARVDEAEQFLGL